MIITKTIQKLINLAAIIAISIVLIKMNINVNKINGTPFRYNQVTRAILKGEVLTESELRLLNQLVKIQMSADEQYTPLCLVKAYSAIYAFLHTNDLFNQIETSHLDFQNVDSCLNYYSVLLYKARNLQIPQKAKVISIFESLQQKEIQRKYAQKKESHGICVFSTTFNSEKIIKDQIAAINRQTFSKYYVEINDRGSTDNTPMIASYKIKEVSGDDQAKTKIFLKTNTEEGIFTALKRFISNCPVHSIILVVGDNDTFLGSNALETVDRIFSTQDLDIAVFSDLETTHLNLELYNQKELGGVKAPILAFRQKILQREDKLLQFEKQTALQPFWRTWLANHLLYLRDTSKLKLKIVNQAFVFRSSSKNTTELALSQQLSTRYDALQ